MKTIEESIAFGAAIMRSPRYWYLDGGHETTITTARRNKYLDAKGKPLIPGSALGKLGIDCVWFIHMIAKDGGWAWMLSASTPWGVGPVMARARQYMATIPIGQQQRGDIAFFGTDHMAMFTEPGYVLQAFDERRGIIRTTLKGVGRKLTLVLRPPYAPPVVVPPPAVPPVTPPPVEPPPVIPPVAVPPVEPPVVVPPVIVDPPPVEPEIPPVVVPDPPVVIPEPPIVPDLPAPAPVSFWAALLAAILRWLNPK
jgi:hypothetical protein